MAVTMTGAEFDAFWDEVLGSDWFIDVCNLPLEEDLRPEEVVEITYLELGWQGGDKERTSTWISEQDLASGPDFDTLVKRWRARARLAYLAVTLPADKADAAIEALLALGATIAHAGQTYSPEA